MKIYIGLQATLFLLLSQGLSLVAPDNKGDPPLTDPRDVEAHRQQRLQLRPLAQDEASQANRSLTTILEPLLRSGHSRRTTVRLRPGRKRRPKSADKSKPPPASGKSKAAQSNLEEESKTTSKHSTLNVGQHAADFQNDGRLPSNHKRPSRGHKRQSQYHKRLPTSRTRVPRGAGDASFESFGDYDGDVPDDHMTMVDGTGSSHSQQALEQFFEWHSTMSGDESHVNGSKFMLTDSEATQVNSHTDDHEHTDDSKEASDDEDDEDVLHLDYKDIVGSGDNDDGVEETLRVEPRRSLLLMPRGKYTSRVEVEKADSDDHPCRLKKTTVKIQFPDMKSEVFVNFLGYKEPNLLNLMRCRGKCRSKHTDQTSCQPLKVRQKRVKMMVKTQLIGREPREKTKEIILDEHVECGCQCDEITQASCLGRFNNRTCECDCDEREYGEERMRCELRPNAYWDTESCQCLDKGVAPRGVDYYSTNDCPQQSAHSHNNHNNFLYGVRRIQHRSSAVEVISWILLGCCITISIFLAATTFYYRNKIRSLLATKDPGHIHGGQRTIEVDFEDDSEEGGWEVMDGGHTRSENVRSQGSGTRSKTRSSDSSRTRRSKRKDNSDRRKVGAEKSTEKVDRKLMAGLRKGRACTSSSSSGGQGWGGAGGIRPTPTSPPPQQQQQQAIVVNSAMQQQHLQPVVPMVKSVETILLLENSGDLYQDQYNEHGVRIEKELSDIDLIEKYFG